MPTRKSDTTFTSPEFHVHTTPCRTPGCLNKIRQWSGGDYRADWRQFDLCHVCTAQQLEGRKSELRTEA
jgi:hypothetical protein